MTMLVRGEGEGMGGVEKYVYVITVPECLLSNQSLPQPLHPVLPHAQTLNFSKGLRLSLWLGMGYTRE
jgi:hypothetical protein